MTLECHGCNARCACEEIHSSHQLGVSHIKVCQKASHTSVRWGCPYWACMSVHCWTFIACVDCQHSRSCTDNQKYRSTMVHIPLLSWCHIITQPSWNFSLVLLELISDSIRQMMVELYLQPTQCWLKWWWWMGARTCGHKSQRTYKDGTESYCSSWKYQSRVWIGTLWGWDSATKKMVSSNRTSSDEGPSNVQSWHVLNEPRRGWKRFGNMTNCRRDVVWCQNHDFHWIININLRVKGVWSLCMQVEVRHYGCMHGERYRPYVSCSNRHPYSYSCHTHLHVGGTPTAA